MFVYPMFHAYSEHIKDQFDTISYNNVSNQNVFSNNASNRNVFVEI